MRATGVISGRQVPGQGQDRNIVRRECLWMQGHGMEMEITNFLSFLAFTGDI